MKYLYFILFVSVSCLLSGCFFSVSGYSEGSRSGKLVKFSKKGLMCKTYEGQLMLGETQGTTWDFSVTDESLANKLLPLIGEEVQLGYDENYLTGICDSETAYIVNKIQQQQ